ncbi:unnamed protein product [Heterobilharzia americana]|nr:unnamed protein product [Heterobilharzia americana]
MISLGAYEYNPADVLGNGAFAIVYKGRVRNNPDELVAIKIMLKDQNVLKSKTLLSKEICVLKDLNHENIVRLYDHSISSTGVYLVMEYCNGGDLSEYLQAKRTLPEDTIRHFLIQIGSAMDAMNRKGFMHRDLKPGNILLSHCRDCGQHVTAIPGYLLSFKLADFGFARFLQDGMMAVTMCGSPMYMAPEVLMCRKYDAVADIWSMGIIVYQCLTGKAPFYANTPEALKNIYEKTACLRPKIPRIDFQNFLNHRFLHQRHFEPRAGSGPESSASRSSVAPVLPSRNRPQVRGSGITVLGQGTGEGPYYLAPQDTNRPRDKTPQGKPLAPNLPGSSDVVGHKDTREWTNPTQWHNNTTANQINKQHQQPGTTSSPTTVTDPFYPQHTGVGVLPPSYDDPDYSLDDIDDEMTKNYSSSPSSDHNNLPKMPPIKPRDFMHTDAVLDNSSIHQTIIDQQRPTTYRSFPKFDQRGVFMNAEMEYGEPPFEDYVIVNPDGSEVQRIDRERFRQQGHLNEPMSQMSNIGRIVRNPGSYLTNNNVKRRGIPDMGPLPDVTVGTAVTDARYFQLPDDSHNNASILRNTNEIPSSVNSNKLADRYYHPMPVDSCGSPTSHKFTTRPISEPIRGPTDYTKEKFNEGQVAEGNFLEIPHHEPLRSNVSLETRDTQLHQLNYQAGPRQLVHPSGLQTITAQRGDVMYPVVTNPNFARNFENDFTSAGLWEAAEFSDEILMESEHNEEIKKITMVLELCELLAELAERRASALADCTPTRVITTDDSEIPITDPSAATDASLPLNSDHQKPKCSVNNGRDNDNCVSDHNIADEEQESNKNSQQTSTALKFVSEAQRIVEQIVLYRRVLYYLEYVFDQVKKAFQNGRLKSTATARRRLIDCNTLYHRCYIRLRQLARQSRREDLIEPVGRLLANITANRLIFQYALDQCYAAEMDEYIGEIALSLQRYKAGITLIHGLCQHAKSQRDKTLLSDCMRLLRDRYACLWSTAIKPNPQTILSQPDNPTNIPLPDNAVHNITPGFNESLAAINFGITG